ncbi:hypothetical protein F4859DRAFT_529972 [Xylaria cf. heliscus]|nr:hypothetical protein F4859DRAFT_529972 [Xylaria cf. heliscus]
MACPGSSSSTEPVPEFCGSGSHNQYYLEDYNLPSFFSTTPMIDDVNYALQQLAAEGLQPMTPDSSDYVGPECNDPCLDPSTVPSSYLNVATGDNLLAASLGYSSSTDGPDGMCHSNLVLGRSYCTPTTPVGFAYSAPWDSWSSPATAESWSLLSSPPLSPSEPRWPGTTTVKQFQCKHCGASFTYRKDLTRHKTSVHATGNEPVYRCRCGKRDVRKDNYRRHVEHCSREHIYQYYMCKCTDNEEDKEIHIQHVIPCRHGFGPSGRPRAGA